MNYKKSIIDQEKTGDNLKKLIVEADITYEKLASLLELNSPRVIYEWVKGKKMPSLENLINLSKILKVELEKIVVVKK